MSNIYGLVAEFDSPDTLLRGAEAAREAGYRKMEAYSPFPVHGLSEVMGHDDPRLPWAVFIMGVIGCATGFGLESWTAAVNYPFNIGGKPYFSWPNFIPVAYELTILFAAFTAGLSMLILNGLPRYHHSIFNTPRFERASSDLFFLCIEARDGKYDAEETTQFLENLGAQLVSEVEK